MLFITVCWLVALVVRDRFRDGFQQFIAGFFRHTRFVTVAFHQRCVNDLLSTVLTNIELISEKADDTSALNPVMRPIDGRLNIVQLGRGCVFHLVDVVL